MHRRDSAALGYQRRARNWLIAALCGVGAALAGADADAPVAVPDDFGLGERLALVAWLHDHAIAVADPQDLPALRRAYLAATGGGIAPTAEERLRADLAADLYRRFGRNPPQGASSAEIAALITELSSRADQASAQDQAAARSDSASHPRSVPPAAAPPAAAPPAAAPPASAPAPPIISVAPTVGSLPASCVACGLAIGKPFPEFSARSADGSTFRLSDLRGKVVLLDAWASWCGPCMNELPNVRKAYIAFHERGLEIIGINLDESAAGMHAAMKSQRIEWPQLFDGKGWKSAPAVQLGIKAIPLTFLIDAKGTLVDAELWGAYLAPAIEKALSGR